NFQFMQNRHSWRAIKDYLIVAGLSVAAWEFFELSYLWGRVGQASAHENILGFWPLDGSGVLYLHAARAIVGIALIWKGSM
ncbi:MAG: hypothetical protein M0P69_18720, partial [Bacteroidales bacterium]|nr:hypothetical protein [Bacteroidales bacterium]